MQTTSLTNKKNLNNCFNPQISKFSNYLFGFGLVSLVSSLEAAGDEFVVSQTWFVGSRLEFVFRRSLSACFFQRLVLQHSVSSEPSVELLFSFLFLLGSVQLG